MLLETKTFHARLVNISFSVYGRTKDAYGRTKDAYSVCYSSMQTPEMFFI